MQLTCPLKGPRGASGQLNACGDERCLMHIEFIAHARRARFTYHRHAERRPKWHLENHVIMCV